MQKYGLYTFSIYGVHETIVWEVYTGIVLYDISYSVGWFYRSYNESESDKL